MRSLSSRACRPALALALAALNACGDYRTPTDAAADPRAHAIIGPGGDDPPANDPPQITALSTNPGTLLIEGAPASFTATLVNPGEYRYDVSVQGLIRQGTARREAVYTALSCGSGQGVLPTGTCTVSAAFTASNSKAGIGTLIAGSATFELKLQDQYGTALATRSVAVTLVAPTFTTVSASSTTLAIDGASVSYTATLQNPGPSVSGVLTKVYVRQGSARREAGSAAVSCGSGQGVLPTGTCAISGTAVASNGSATTQLLVPGPASFEVHLTSASGAVLAIGSIVVTLVAPSFTSLTLAATSFYIDSATVGYTATIANPGFSRSGVAVQGWMNQSRIGGTVSHAAGGLSVSCGSAPGELPAGTCTVSFAAGASNAPAVGAGELLAGPATLVLELKSGQTVLDTITAQVNLVRTRPEIAELTIPPEYAQVSINGAWARYRTVIDNPGPPRDSILVRGWLTQGTTTRRFATAAWPDCGGGMASLVLPSGQCSMYGWFAARSDAQGTGTLVRGSATLELELVDRHGTVLHRRSTPVTLSSW